MKRGLTYALASSAACIALAALLVPYAPMPKAEGIGKIEVLGTIQGGYHQYVTRWLDTDEVRQLLPQIRMNSIPEILGGNPDGELVYRIETDYNGEQVYFLFYFSEFYSGAAECYVTYDGRWMHSLRGSKDAVQRLNEICSDACAKELADTIYWK